MIRRFARPYARAIMDVTGKPEVASALLRELEQFESARHSAQDLADLYRNPGIDAASKTAITATIARKLGLTELAERVLDVLIRNHRINDLQAIIDALAQSVREAMGVVAAQVRAAHRLSTDEVAALQRTLQQKAGRPVEMEVTTDPTLLGGFVARIGSEIYDASVAGKIEKFRTTLP